ncbi:hypothetical protein JHK86_006933 [Glycine max]|nr:hypothetical protein JHK86_006933 [Glycine max]
MQSRFVMIWKEKGEDSFIMGDSTTFTQNPRALSIETIELTRCEERSAVPVRPCFTRFGATGDTRDEKSHSA